MTPAEHIARAEELLYVAGHTEEGWISEHRMEVTAEALTHALIAIAVELGAPHPAAAQAVPDGT